MSLREKEYRHRILVTLERAAQETIAHELRRRFEPMHALSSEMIALLNQLDKQDRD